MDLFRGTGNLESDCPPKMTKAVPFQVGAVGTGPDKKDRKTTVRKIILSIGPRATKAMSPPEGEGTCAG